MATPAELDADLGWSLGAVMRAYLRAAAAVVADVPGGPRGHQVLAAAARGGASTQLALAHHLGVDRTVMTYLLDDLERAGLVARRPDPADRRAGTLRLTPRGRREFARQSAAHEGWIAELLAGLTPPDQAALHRLLGRAKEGARAAIGEGSE